MKHISFFTLFAVLVGSLAASAQALPQAPKQPGWVIILGADYKGPLSPHFDRAQRDAIAAYRTATEAWHVPLDHIILLAEGEEIDKFEKTGSIRTAVKDENSFYYHSLLDPETNQPYANTKDPEKRAKCVEVTTGLLKSLADQPNMTMDCINFLDMQTHGLDRQTFGLNTYKTGDRVIPWLANPTAINFRRARNIVSHLAEPGQFVAIVVASYGQSIDSGAGRQLTLFPAAATPPDLGQDSLSVSDFTLPDCKAEDRLMLMSVQTLANARLTNSDLDRASGQLRRQLAGTNKATTILAASESGDDSTFLVNLFQYMTDSRNWLNGANLRSCFDAAKNTTQAAARLARHAVEPVFAQPLDNIDEKAWQRFIVSDTPIIGLPVMMNEGDIASTSNKITCTVVQDLEYGCQPGAGGKASTGALVALLKIGDMQLMRVPGTAKLTAAERGKKIERRLTTIKSLLDRNPLKNTDEFRILPQENGEVVVLVPASLQAKYRAKLPEDMVDFVVTADREAAKSKRTSTKALATQYSNILLRCLDDAQWRKVGAYKFAQKNKRMAGQADSWNSEDWMEHGKTQSENGNFAKAELYFRNAIALRCDLPSAYLSLCGACLAQNKRVEAKKALDDMMVAMDWFENIDEFYAETVKNLRAEIEGKTE